MGEFNAFFFGGGEETHGLLVHKFQLFEVQNYLLLRAVLIFGLRSQQQVSLGCEVDLLALLFIHQ